MSLVGSLEDLGLGDILQIVSLARKSGLLFLRTESGEGRIVFDAGLVRAAYRKGGPETLRELLISRGLGDPAAIEAVCAQALTEDWPQHTRDERLAESCGVTLEDLHGLRRKALEQVVFAMFRWRGGEFSFEICDELDAGHGELSVEVGVNAQYLTMEATRLGDEGEREAEPAPAAVAPQAPPGESVATEVASTQAAEPPSDAREALALATAGAAETGEPEPLAPVSAAPPVPAPEAPAVASPREAVPLVIIDAELRALEWLKGKLAKSFARVHIFQHSEGGVARIRQYLGRGQVPVVLVSSRMPVDSLRGTADAGELLRRLRAQAPRMPILAMVDGDGEKSPRGVDAADGVVVRPSLRLLADDRRRGVSERMAEELRQALAEWSTPEPEETGGAPDARAALERLRAISERLRNPGTQGELLELVLAFGAECFNRVALFMIREEEAVGIAERGLGRAGGPEGEAIRSVRTGLREPAWFRLALEGSASGCSPPCDAGDEALAAQLGQATPREAYVGVIESGGQPAALLYADNLPDGGAAESVDALDIVLHEVGLALDRALLERALEAAERPSA